MNLPSRHIGLVTLDELWAKAASIGVVSIDHLGGQHVEIKFYSARKSLVYARGYHSDIYEAFQIAISEAYILWGRDML